jgi:hypothetical protein
MLPRRCPYLQQCQHDSGKFTRDAKLRLIKRPVQDRLLYHFDEFDAHLER